MMHKISVHSQDNPRALQTPFGSGLALETLSHDARVSNGAIHAGHTTQLTSLILPKLKAALALPSVETPTE